MNGNLNEVARFCRKLSTLLEAGVPILSKIPVLGRLFSNRSSLRDEKILLILVKPTIILQEETEHQAIASMEEVIPAARP